MNYTEDQLHTLELLPYVALARKAGRSTMPVAISSATSAARSAADAVAGIRSSRVGETAIPLSRVAINTIPGLAATLARVGRVVPIAAVGVAPATIASRVDASSLDWPSLQQAISVCTACGLCKQRKHAVPGIGAEKAPWLFIGEGPGAEEDEVGEPFVGPGGRLLDAMLTAAGLARGREVYLTNVVKCRPPGNRTPSAEETLACASYLDRQIDLIAPAVIVALGKTAVARLTGEDASMASMRGQVHRYRGIPVIATYHPLYLLRSLPEKLKAWEDLVLAKRTLAAAKT